MRELLEAVRRLRRIGTETFRECESNLLLATLHDDPTLQFRLETVEFLKEFRDELVSVIRKARKDLTETPSPSSN